MSRSPRTQLEDRQKKKWNRGNVTIWRTRYSTKIGAVISDDVMIECRSTVPQIPWQHKVASHTLVHSRPGQRGSWSVSRVPFHVYIFEVHCIELHYIAFHDSTWHWIALDCVTSHYIVLYYSTSHWITSHCMSLHCITSHCISLHQMTLYCTTLHHSITLCCVTLLHYIASHCISLHCITSHCISLRRLHTFITFMGETSTATIPLLGVTMSWVPSQDFSSAPANVPLPQLPPVTGVSANWQRWQRPTWCWYMLILVKKWGYHHVSSTC